MRWIVPVALASNRVAAAHLAIEAAPPLRLMLYAVILTMRGKAAD
jgi:hypothetical protein